MAVFRSVPSSHGYSPSTISRPENRAVPAPSKCLETWRQCAPDIFEASLSHRMAPKAGTKRPGFFVVWLPLALLHEWASDPPGEDARDWTQMVVGCFGRTLTCCSFATIAGARPTIETAHAHGRRHSLHFSN